MTHTNKQRRPLVAWCWANGLIEWSRKKPAGEPFAICPSLATSKHYRSCLSGLCRLSYDNRYLLVPGLPENPGDYDSFERFWQRVNQDILSREAENPTPGLHLAASEG